MSMNLLIKKHVSLTHWSINYSISKYGLDQLTMIVYSLFCTTGHSSFYRLEYSLEYIALSKNYIHIKHEVVLVIPPTDPADETSFRWVKSKRSYSCDWSNPTVFELWDAGEQHGVQVVYVATMQVVPINDISGCSIERSFVCDPAKEWRLEDFL